VSDPDQAARRRRNCLAWRDICQTSAHLSYISQPSVVISLLSNPWEEIGWRGFALPRLQGRYGAAVATLLVMGVRE